MDVTPSNIWQCKNKGSGESCYAVVPWEATTSLTLDECKSQCQAFLKNRRESQYADYANRQSCAEYDKNGKMVLNELESLDNDGDRGRRYAIKTIADAFINGGSGTNDPDFNKLDSVINEWIASNSKLYDGRPKINFVMHGFESAFDRFTNNDILYKKIQELRNKKPDSAYPINAESEYWIDYAWKARGSSYAYKVNSENWKLFRERISMAEKVLLDNKKVASEFPWWYAQMVVVQGALGNYEKRDEVFYEGASRYKNHLPLYIVMRNYSEPKWGGSWQKVDDFINWASSNVDESERLSVYARLYFGVRDNMVSGKSFFRDTVVDWQKLKLAFEDLVKRHPDSMSLLGEFADLSCEANDKQTYIKLRKQLGNNIFHVDWGGKEMPMQCDIKFGYSD